MSVRIKILLFLILPILMIGFWIYILLGFMGGKKSMSGDIIGANKDNPKIQSGSTVLVSTGTVKSTGINNFSGSTNDLNDEEALSGDQIGTMELAVTGDNSKIPDSDKESIYVYMPSFAKNKGFGILARDMMKNNNIRIKYITFKDFNDYRKTLYQDLKSGKKVDVALIPSDWVNTYKESSYKIDFSSDISDKFNFVFGDLLGDKNFSFVPFAIDPMLTFVSKGTVNSDILTLDKLKQSLLVSTDKASKLFMDIRMLFGIGNKDLIFLKTNNEPFDNYFTFLYAMLYQSYLSQSSDYLDYFIKIATKDDSLFRNYDKFKKFVAIGAKKNPECDYYKRLCMLANGFSAISFGFLSDLDVYENSFMGSKMNLFDYDLYNFPVSSNIYPVRGWGFIVNKDTKDLKGSLLFINEYIKEGSAASNRFLWSNMLSAFNDTYQKQVINKRLDKLMQFEPKFQLIIGSVYQQKEFTKSTKIIDVVSGLYSIESFLDNLDWIF